MLYNHNNKEEFDKIYLHDAIFEGFNYDYDKREICFTCKHYDTNKIYNFKFHNVIYSKLQSCSFWNGGNSVYDIYSTEMPDEFTQLIQDIQNNAAINFEVSYLNRGITYIAIETTINSGDTLLIVCENVEVSKSELNE